MDPLPSDEPELPFYMETRPAELEDICDGFDNDEDGEVDEDCYCKAGSRQHCYNGPEDTEGVGACRSGWQQCTEVSLDFQLGKWGSCEEAVLPTEEICGNGIDEDCDGVDEPCHPTGGCEPLSVTECYDGPEGTVGIGICNYGQRTCNEQGEWGPCIDAVMPLPDVCENGLDEDCNGRDEPCIGPTCVPGQEQPCYDGPAPTVYVGICVSGVQTCTSEGKWTACEGQVLPDVEVCGNNIDEDCDGTFDACD